MVFSLFDQPIWFEQEASIVAVIVTLLCPICFPYEHPKVKKEVKNTRISDLYFILIIFILYLISLCSNVLADRIFNLSYERYRCHSLLRLCNRETSWRNTIPELFQVVHWVA